MVREAPWWLPCLGANLLAVSLSDHEWVLLEKACTAVPPPARPPAIGTDDDYPDYVTNLQLTVLDLQLRNVIVNSAIEHYRRHRWNEIRTLQELQEALARFPDDRDGNRDAARYLWGYLYGDRLGRLRGLANWMQDHGIIDQDRLREWAHTSSAADFVGQIKGLGAAAYAWLVMRLGVDTVKPDLWIHRFTQQAIGRDLDDTTLVDVITEAAHRVGRQARELDGGIWEMMRGEAGAI